MPKDKDTDRVRRHTARSVLARIDDETRAHLLECAQDGPEAADERLHALEREWDTDRTIEAEASAVGLAGLALGVCVSPALLVVPGAVALSLALHATTGWYPLLPLLRRLGFRSAREIDRERHALKALRGDFAALEPMPMAAPEPVTAGVPAVAQVGVDDLPRAGIH